MGLAGKSGQVEPAGETSIPVSFLPPNVRVSASKTTKVTERNGEHVYIATR